MGNVEEIHQVDAEEIAEDGDDIRYHTALLMPQFDEGPSLISAVKMDKHCGQQNGEHVDEGEHLQLIGPGHQSEITEDKQCHHTYQRQIEGGEQHAYQPCA